LESYYNSFLSGTPGRIFRRYDMYNTVITDENPAIPGHALITTLDSGIQGIAQKAADNAASLYQPEHASVIVMDPNTGEILAMAQSPSFDSNRPGDPSGFTDPLLSQTFGSLSEDAQLEALYSMWANFNITSTFEPGSIFKPIVIAAALEEGIITPNSTYYCDGHLQVADRDIACWIKATGRIHGSQTLTQALANSCNVALMQMVASLGRDLFYNYRNDFGFGEKTGIDLPGENGASASSLMYSLEQLNAVELATSSIGQGFNCTAIQAITAFCAVINGGNLMQPHVVSQIVDNSNAVVKENKPTIIRKAISSETSEWMRQAMVNVISPEGTGRNAMIEGYAIGGKTGTAQQGAERDKYTVSFIGYLPADNPQYVAMALIDKPYGDTTGSTSAAPMLKEVLEGIIEYKGLAPSDSDAAHLPSGIEMPNFSGQDLASVTHQLNGLSLDYMVSGYGNFVTGQFPSAGQLATPGSEIILYVEPSGVSEAELATVPNVVGLSLAQAEAALDSVGLIPIAYYDPTSIGGQNEPITSNVAEEAPYSQSLTGIVYDQMPAAGIKVTPQVEVKIKLRLLQ
jgi:stage V sporulation protein D (sporulation-specific penicillin-binding protein)